MHCMGKELVFYGMYMSVDALTAQWNKNFSLTKSGFHINLKGHVYDTKLFYLTIPGILF